MKPSDFKLAIIVSQFNPEVTEGLKAGALALLGEHGVLRTHVEVFSAPGAFEIPLLAQTAAKSKRFNGVICLGCVIKGDTAHFEYISLGATMGLQMAMLATETPITFGILTTYDDEQARVRSQMTGEHAPHNKGREAALACIEAIQAQFKIKG